MHLLWASTLGANAWQKNRAIERIQARWIVQSSPNDYPDVSRLVGLVRSYIERGTFIDHSLWSMNVPRSM